MKQHQFIKKIISVFLLAVFAVSISPQLYLHDAVATHNDAPAACTDQKTSAHLHQAGISCHFEQLVVNTPYLFSLDHFTAQCSFVFVEHAFNLAIFNLAEQHFSRDSRGPPSLS